MTSEKLEVITDDIVEEKATEVKPPRKSRKRSVKKDNGYLILDGYFRVEEGIFSIVKRNIEKRKNTLLLGPTGVGKTELVAAICKEMKLPLTIFDMGTMKDPVSSLLGSHTIKVIDDHTVSTFSPSRFSQVIQKPGVILLDELNRADIEANNLLFPCTDFRRQLPMEYCFDDCEPINVHPDCTFIATANTGSQYTGTHKLDKALINRFIVLEMDPLPKDVTKSLIKSSYSELSIDKIDMIVDTYFSINKEHDDFKIQFNLSLRQLKEIADMVEDGFTIYDSFFSICKGIGSKEGLKSIESIVNKTKTIA